MRKIITIIHGRGVNNGIGKEGGGDLDTVSSNAFYLVWAKNFLKEKLGREMVYGEDFEFDFLNYSEGVASLAVHSGCDIYLPDFPIDALAPRLKLMVIEDEGSIELINEFTRKMNDFRAWMVQHSDRVSDEFKAIFNATLKQAPKVLEHQARATLLTALKTIQILRSLMILDAAVGPRSGKEAPPALAGFRQGVIEYLTGSKLQELKKELLAQFDDSSKEKMIDELTDRDAILAFDEANSKDMSTRGRVNYTDELLIVLVETMDYLIRGRKQLRDLPWSEKGAHDYGYTLRALEASLQRYLKAFLSLASGVEEEIGESNKELFSILKKGGEELLRIFSRVEEYLPPPRSEEKTFSICLLLVEEATGQAVPGIEVVIKKVKGEGQLLLPDGTRTGDKEVVLETDPAGKVKVVYEPISLGEEYLFSVTFDDLLEIFLPAEVPIPSQEFEAGFDAVREGLQEEVFVEQEESPPGPDRAMRVALKMIERQFRDLHENDVRFVSVDDHHPYTREIFDLLKKLEEEGIIQHIQIASLPRGEELPVEKQKCGADLVYQDRIKDKPWDNPGLAELRRIAHLQDLHIELTPLGLELSKLIGSKFGKIEMARGMADRIRDYDSMVNIMKNTGWDKLVQAYEDGLEKVYPRVEQTVGQMLFRKPDGTVRITAALSPFCDPKKGEVQINVASAIHYLLSRKKNASDYFFYCYGSHLMTTRRPNENETTLNLSTMCQQIGTKADGGHSGAATCKPDSNPSFPVKALAKMKDTIFLEFLEYLAGKITEYSGLELVRITELDLHGYSEGIERALKHVREKTFEIILEGKEDPADRIRVLFTRAPQIKRRLGEEKPSFIQVLNYLKRHQEFDYLIFSQGMLYRVILTNVADEKKRLDLPELARTIGWSEDRGQSLQAVADIKKNKSVKKRLRRMLNPHLVQLAEMMGEFIEKSGGYRPVSVRPVLFDGVEEDFKAICARMDPATYLAELKSSSGETMKLVAALSPSINPKAGETEPSLGLVAEHFRGEAPNYLVYSESELRFPRKETISVLTRVDDPAGRIDCDRAVEAVAGRKRCGNEVVAEYMPAFVEGSPAGRSRLTPANYRQFLEFILPRMFEPLGWTVSGLRPLNQSGAGISQE